MPLTHIHYFPYFSYRFYSTAFFDCLFRGLSLFIHDFGGGVWKESASDPILMSQYNYRFINSNTAQHSSFARDRSLNQQRASSPFSPLFARQFALCTVRCIMPSIVLGVTRTTRTTRKPCISEYQRGYSAASNTRNIHWLTQCLASEYISNTFARSLYIHCRLHSLYLVCVVSVFAQRKKKAEGYMHSSLFSLLTHLSFSLAVIVGWRHCASALRLLRPWCIWLIDRPCQKRAKQTRFDTCFGDKNVAAAVFLFPCQINTFQASSSTHCTLALYTRTEKAQSFSVAMCVFLFTLH